jgi:5-hydroxyisourate hydrolase
MPGISIHVVDVSRGVVAAGLRVEVFLEEELVLEGKTSAKGLIEDGSTFAAGHYEAVLHIGEWYEAQGVELPAVAFLDVVTYRFGISDPAQHYHLPFKCTPWGYSCFRGGA